MPVPLSSQCFSFCWHSSYHYTFPPQAHPDFTFPSAPLHSVLIGVLHLSGALSFVVSLGFHWQLQTLPVLPLVSGSVELFQDYSPSGLSRIFKAAAQSIVLDMRISTENRTTPLKPLLQGFIPQRRCHLLGCQSRVIYIQEERSALVQFLVVPRTVPGLSE